MALSQKGATYSHRNEIPDGPIKRALDDIASRQLAGFNQVNATPHGVTPAPSQISSLSVTGADGIFDAQIQDDGAADRGLEYFLEYSTAPSGPWTVVPIGPTRNWRRNLGNRTFYWRAYSQYKTSEASLPIYFGGATSPTPVVGGGAAAGPTPQPSAGSGTAPSNGLSGGEGYGRLQSRNPKVFQPA